jgi:hypothetical protein
MQKVIVDQFAAYVSGEGYTPIRNKHRPAAAELLPPGDKTPVFNGLDQELGVRPPVADGPLPLREVAQAYAAHWRNAYTKAELARRLGISTITLTKYLGADTAIRNEIDKRRPW